eukprot:scaffold170272_cov33-Tisochrysis_lutea.AAC.2
MWIPPKTATPSPGDLGRGIRKQPLPAIGATSCACAHDLHYARLCRDDTTCVRGMTIFSTLRSGQFPTKGQCPPSASCAFAPSRCATRQVYAMP